MCMTPNAALREKIIQISQTATDESQTDNGQLKRDDYRSVSLSLSALFCCDEGSDPGEAFPISVQLSVHRNGVYDFDLCSHCVAHRAVAQRAVACSHRPTPFKKRRMFSKQAQVTLQGAVRAVESVKFGALLVNCMHSQSAVPQFQCCVMQCTTLHLFQCRQNINVEKHGVIFFFDA